MCPAPSRQSVNIGLIKTKEGILHPVGMDLIENSHNVLGSRGEWMKSVTQQALLFCLKVKCDWWCFMGDMWFNSIYNCQRVISTVLISWKKNVASQSDYFGKHECSPSVFKIQLYYLKSWAAWRMVILQGLCYWGKILLFHFSNSFTEVATFFIEIFRYSYIYLNVFVTLQ